MLEVLVLPIAINQGNYDSLTCLHCLMDHSLCRLLVCHLSNDELCAFLEHISFSNRDDTCCFINELFFKLYQMIIVDALNSLN